MFVPRKDALPGARHPVEPTSANPAPLPTFRRAPWAASIRARMNILGLSLRNAAPKIGVSVATLNRISREDGVAEPGMTTYLRVNRWLADTYGTVMQAGCDANPTVCHAGRDGECVWLNCPQLRDGEPAKTGRSCPNHDGKDPYE